MSKITIILLVFFLYKPIVYSQSIGYNYKDIPYVKGECLVEIEDTLHVVGLTSLKKKENPIISTVNEMYKIDQTEEILIKNNIAVKFHNTPKRRIIYKIKFQDKQSDIIKLVSEIKHISGIVNAEPNYLFKAFETIPNEYTDRQNLALNQWALDRIKAPEGWDLETGDTNVIITILDSGVDWNHPDLKNNIWKNCDEIPDNGLDDDNNGYIDDYFGWDFVSATINQVKEGEDPGPGDNNPQDFNGHGTHVSGIAGAEANNNLGIAGLAWNCQIMPVRAGYENKDGEAVLSYSDLIPGIYYAVDNGTDIINMSFGVSFIGAPYDTIFGILKNAIAYADNHGVILVASAGNDPIEGLTTYPAAFDKVISVTASTYGNQKASFATFNSSWLDVVAPGVDILSTYYYNGYQYEDGAYTHLSGTSMAAPFVSGLAALIKSKNPSFTKNDITTIIKNEVDVPNSQLFIGRGIINVQKALQINNETKAIAIISSPHYDEFNFLDSINILGCVHGDNYKLEYGVGYYPDNWTVIDSGSQNIDGLITTWHIREIPNGMYTLRLSVDENSRSISDIITFYIKRNSYPLLKGWPASTGDEIHSSPVVADLESDGKKEVIVYGSDGYLYVWDCNGIIKQGWPKFLGASRSFPAKQNWVMGTPAVMDIDNDGYNDIIIGSLDGRLYVLDHNSNDLKNFPVQLSGRIYSSPTIFDLNNDGTIEIICRSENQLYIVDVNGKVLNGWPEHVASIGLEVWSNQAVGDLDNDGDYEIVVGSEYYNNSEDRDNKIYAFHDNGQIVNGWPINLNPSGEYTGWVLSSPVIGDLDGNGTNEVVVGSDDHRLWVFNGDGTNFNSSWPKYLPYGFRASPAIADLDNDSDLEIVIGHISDMDPNLRLYAFHHNGTLMNNWPYELGGVGGFTFGWISPVIGDINNNDSLDVISIMEVGSFLGKGGGDICALNTESNLLNGFPIGLPDISYNSPTIDDIDSDNDVDIIAGDLSGNVYIWDLSFQFNKERIPWGQFRHDNWNTGLYGFKPVPPRPIVFDVNICEGDSIPFLFASGENIHWYSDEDLNSLVYEGSQFRPSIIQAGSYSYYATQNPYGREGPATKVILTIASKVPPPTVYDTSICEGQIIPELIANGENIRWYNDSLLTETIHLGNSLSIDAIIPGSYEFYVTQSIGDCESDADSVVLRLKPMPNLPVVINISVCENEPIPALTAEGQNILWFNDSTCLNQLYEGNVFNSGYSETGKYIYYVTQTVSNCQSLPQIACLTINPLPEIDLGQDTVLNPDQGYILGSYTDDYSYLWSDGSENAFYDISAQVLGAGMHVISVLVTDSNLCRKSDTLLLNILPAVNIYNPGIQDGVIIYPNPVTDILNIKLLGFYEEHVVITIYNQYGQEIQNETFFVNRNIYNSLFKTNSLSSGIYYLVIILNKKHYVEKILVQNDN